MCAHALFAGAQKMDGEKPLVKRNVAVSEDRANGDGELLTASGALPHTGTNVLVLLGFLRL
jgi:hypothetical protein